MPTKNYVLLFRRKGEKNWGRFDLNNLFSIYVLLEANFKKDIPLEAKIATEEELSNELPFTVDER